MTPELQSARDQIAAIARKYGHAGCNADDHRFCQLVLVIAAMGAREQEYLLTELRGGM